MNPILSKIIEGIESHVKPESKQAYENAVLAGKKIMFNPATHSHMQLVANPASRQDPVNTISSGVAGLIWIMYMESKKTMKIDVMVMTGITIMCDVFDFAERAYNIPVTNQIVADTTKKLCDALFAKLGITPQQLQQQIMKGRSEIVAHRDQQGSKQPQGMLPQAQPTSAAPGEVQ